MPVLGDVKYGEDLDIEKAPVLSDEDKHAVKERMLALDKLLAEQKKAKYKIELFLGSKRSTKNPTPGALSFWESGSMLHGGGDAKIYFCAGKEKGVNNCDKPIPFAFNGYGFLVCPACQKTWKGADVVGEVLGRHSMRQWAELIYKYYARLEHNCDIYVKHALDDIRTVAQEEQLRRRDGELLSKARNKRALVIYPLKNQIIDVAGGADLAQRFFVMLTS